MNILIVNHTDETRYPGAGSESPPSTLAAGGAVEFRIPTGTTDVYLKIVPEGYVLKFLGRPTEGKDEKDLTPCGRCYTRHDPSDRCPSADPPLPETTCSHCLKRLRHDMSFCPLFPEVEPPHGCKKWDRCVCLVHTCYDAAALRRRIR